MKYLVHCFAAALLSLLPGTAVAVAQESFERIATFPLFSNYDISTQTVASSVSANAAGDLLIYTDTVQGGLGFVDITDPAMPLPAGTLDVEGSPFSVAVLGKWAVVASRVNADAGVVLIVDLKLRKVCRTIPVAGIPGDVAVSPDGQFATVAVESSGRVLVIDAITPFPVFWPTRVVDLNGAISAARPRSVSISQQGRCAVAMTENNAVIVLDLNHHRSMRILMNPLFPNVINGAKIDQAWDAYTVTVNQIDATRNKLVELVETLSDVPRKPAAVTWLGANTLATANRDSRGFSVFQRQGNVLFDAGNQLEHLAARIGHFPEQLADVWGSEPNAVLAAKYQGMDHLFVSVRSAGMVGVYRMQGNVPIHLQTLPTARGPSALLSIPQRGLFVVGTDLDNRVGKFRSAITIFQVQAGPPSYPTLESADRADGTPIPWAGISGLSADPSDSELMYAVYDNRYRKSTILKIDLAGDVPTIFDEIPMINTGAIASLPLGVIDVDPEGVAVRPQGGFWVATEGNTPPQVPAVINDQLLQIAPNGVVEKEIILPASLRAQPFRFGFEGVTCVKDANGDEMVYVCVQRKWPDDPVGFCKIGRYDVAKEQWTFALYPLDAPTSPYPGTNWVGLSEITALDANTLLILERDNQAGTDARIKRLYQVDISDIEFKEHGVALEEVSKQLFRDILPDMEAPQGYVLEKVEGVAALPNGEVWIVVDNDGSSVFGETQLINLGKLLD